MLVGAPGTGKSTLAHTLSRALGLEVVETDRVRKLLFAEPRYTGGEHAAVYGWCHNLIRTCLATGHSILFDATNLEERNRRRLYQIADTFQARVLLVWTACPARVVQQRLLKRAEHPDPEDYSDANWAIHLALRQHADPIRRPHVVINTAVDYSSALRRILALAATP